MGTSKKPDDLPPEKLEEIIRKVEEEVEEIVHEQKVLGDPNRPPDYDPEFTRDVLELGVKDPIEVASAIAKEFHAEEEFNNLLEKEGSKPLRAPDLVYIVDNAVLAKASEKKPSLWHRTKAWYHRRGSRFKFNAEICSGAAVGLPLSMGGGGLFNLVYSYFPAVQRLRDITIPLGEYVPFFDDLNGLSALIAGSTVVLAGAASWIMWKYVRDRNQKSVYEDYPEIKHRDYGKYISAQIGVGGVDSAIRIYTMSSYDQLGYDSWVAAAISIVPATLFSLGLMNVVGSLIGLVRDDEKLKNAMLTIEGKRSIDAEKLKAKNDLEDYTPS